MTLVVGVLAREYAVLVADRRLTGLRSRLEEDGRNKMTVYENRLAFGYTGLAKIGGQRTDLWLADVLSKADGSGEAIRGLAARATETFQQLQLPADMKRMRSWRWGGASGIRNQTWNRSGWKSRMLTRPRGGMIVGMGLAGRGKSLTLEIDGTGRVTQRELPEGHRGGKGAAERNAARRRLANMPLSMRSARRFDCRRAR